MEVRDGQGWGIVLHKQSQTLARKFSPLLPLLAPDRFLSESESLFLLVRCF